MKITILFLSFALICFLTIGTAAQDYGEFECMEVEAPYEGIPQRGGRYFSEQGEVRAMVVFVQFAGDTTKPNN